MLFFKRLINRRKINSFERDCFNKRKNLENYLSDDKKIVREKENKNKTFKGIFKHVQFLNCSFEGCLFKHVQFHNCSFIGCSIFTTEFIDCNEISLDTLSFRQCVFSLVNFTDCNIPLLEVSESLLYNKVNFTNVNLDSSVFVKNAYFRTCFVGNCNLRNTRFMDSINWMDIQFINDNSYVKMNEQTRIENFDDKDNLYYEDFSEIPGKYTYLSNTYRNFSKQLKMNDQNGQEQELLYTAYVFEAKSKRGLTRLLYRIANISCGYGEKWKNSVRFSLAIIFVFAFIYMFVGIEVTSKLLSNGTTPSKDTYLIDFFSFGFNGLNSILPYIKDFTVSAYFSTMTFTTVGYGNITTINYCGMILSAIEMFSGAVMMSVMIGTILRRLTR